MITKIMIMFQTYEVEEGEQDQVGQRGPHRRATRVPLNPIIQKVPVRPRKPIRSPKSPRSHSHEPQSLLKPNNTLPDSPLNQFIGPKKNL